MVYASSTYGAKTKSPSWQNHKGNEAPAMCKRSALGGAVYCDLPCAKAKSFSGLNKYKFDIFNEFRSLKAHKLSPLPTHYHS